MTSSNIDERITKIFPVDAGLTIFGVTPGGGAAAGYPKSAADREAMTMIFSKIY